MEKKYDFILGSSSPRRKELIQLLGIPFRIIVPDIDETLDHQLSLEEQCQNISKNKAYKIKQLVEMDANKTPKIILSADTLVGINNVKLEKPKDIHEAKKMLMILSGKTHKVITGLTFLYQDLQLKWLEKTLHALTLVEFHKLSEELIDDYVQSKDGLDKAGGYGIQGFAGSFVKSLNGTHANVVGLPIDLIVQFLEHNISSHNTHWKKKFT
jgi:septum formation protein